MDILPIDKISQNRPKSIPFGRKFKNKSPE